jgi:hypothetical protein
MPFNGSGVFERLYNWTEDAAAGIKILADRMDNEMDGMADGLSNVLTRDGQAGMLAILNAGGFRVTNVASPVDNSDAVNLSFFNSRVTNSGLGSVTSPTLADLDNIGTVTGFYRAITTTVGTWPFPVQTATVLVHRFNATACMQVMTAMQNNTTQFNMWYRQLINSVWGPWRACAIQDVPIQATRAAFVTWAAANAPRVGAVATVAGFSYVFVGSVTVIPDLPGWVPLGEVYLEHYGVETASNPDSATVNYTLQVQAAFDNTEGYLIFTGWVKVIDKIIGNPRCTPHCPAGHDVGGFSIHADFNLAASCVYQPSTGGAVEGGAIGWLGFNFAQVAAAGNGLRSSIVQYPWAIGLASPAITRFVIDFIRIQGCWNGLDMRGNCGGLKVGNVEISAFNQVMNVNGPLDFCNFQNIHVWPFGFSSVVNLTNIYYDGVAEVYFGDVSDGLSISTIASFRVKITCAYRNTILPLKIDMVSLDGDGARWIQTSGRVLVNQLYSSKTDAPAVASIQVTGGVLNIAQIMSGGGEQPSSIRVDGGDCRIHGGELLQSELGFPAAEVVSGSLTVAGVYCRISGTRTAPFFKQSGTGILKLYDIAAPAPSGYFTMVSIATDVGGNYVDLHGLNQAWIMTLPVFASTVLGTYLNFRDTLVAAGTNVDFWPNGDFMSNSITETVAVSMGLPALGGSGSDLRWWNVVTAGNAGNRANQFAIELFGINTTRGRTFKRVKHDTWFPWVEIESAVVAEPAKAYQELIADVSLTVANTWVDYITTALFTATATALSADAYVEAGVVSLAANGVASFEARVLVLNSADAVIATSLAATASYKNFSDQAVSYNNVLKGVIMLSASGLSIGTQYKLKLQVRTISGQQKATRGSVRGVCNK